MTAAAFAKRYGQWAVVTGASDGIGRALAVGCAKRGLNVVVVARRRALLEVLAAELRAATGVDVRALDVDLASPAGVARLLDETRSLDVGLLACAAGFGTSGPLIDADVTQELEMMQVNCGAVLALTHAFGARFAAQRRGGIILMSSIVAFCGVPLAAHYAATKAYIQSLAEGLHHELAGHNVDVLASAPGPVVSGFGARARMQIENALTPQAVAEGTLGALGRAGTVRPGALSKLLELSLSMLPRWLRVQALGRVMRGLTAPMMRGPRTLP